MQSIGSSTSRTLEFGIYRDGDNNLDLVQSATLVQAVQQSARDETIEFTVQDTTARRGLEPQGQLRTESYRIADGKLDDVAVSPPHDMSSRENLARFVAQTLDDAQAAGARSSWIDLVDHGGGDGGGLQVDHGRGLMRSDDIAGAIADGIALHSTEHPEDAGRGIDGIVANQCLMSTLAFSSALSQAGVKFLAASPETMLAPGVPSNVAGAIAHHLDDPKGMARAVVRDVMQTHYGIGGGTRFGPAAAFDVLDLDSKKIATVERHVKALNDAIVAGAKDKHVRSIVREDVKAIDGMVRFPASKGMPWHADRPAATLYDTLAHDGRLDDSLRQRAATARDAVNDLVLAHGESDGFAPFDGADYSDATGPNVHVPVTPKQIDPWAPSVSETDNAFYRKTDGDALARAIA